MEDYDNHTHDEHGEYYTLCGKYHRLNGPAVIYQDGAEAWYCNGKRHRLNGPASIGAYWQEWFIDGAVEHFVLLPSDIIHIGEPIDITRYPSLTLLEDHEYDSMYRIGKEDLCLLRLEHRVVATFVEE